jgi:hypothetical protein
MSIVMGIVALSLMAGGPEKPADTERISYSVHTVDLPAIEWREASLLSLKSVNQPGVQVWTCSRSTADSLVARKVDEAKVVSLEHLYPGAEESIGLNTNYYFVSGFTPIVDNHWVNFRPRTDSLLVGYTATISAQSTTGGIVTKIKSNSHWLAEVRDVRSSLLPGELTFTVQMPQMVTSQIDGEWTIPDGEVLLISLGSYNPSKKDAPTIERLAIIEAHKVAAPSPEVVPAGFDTVSAPEARGGQPLAALGRRAAPPRPSRSLLPAIGPDGKEVVLPALPDHQVATTSHEGPPAPRPSPQAIVPATGMRYDASVAPARYEPTPIGQSAIGLDGAVLASGRPQTIRIPLSGRLSIELKASIVPAEPHE